MNESDKASGLSAKAIGIMVLVAVLGAAAAHALQQLLLGETSTAISGGVATALAVIAMLAVRKS